MKNYIKKKSSWTKSNIIVLKKLTPKKCFLNQNEQIIR